MDIFQVLLTLGILTSFSSAQAPGDGSPMCINEYIDGTPNPFFVMRPNYPKNVWPLMDSSDYTSLLIGEEAVWQQVDADTNNMPGLATNWFQLSSIPCGGNIFVCGFTAGPQENWLVTQHISRILSSGQKMSSISVKIQYELQSCDEERDCTQSLELYKFETSTIDLNITQKMKDFVRVGAFHSNSTGGMLTRRINLEFDSEETGVYLALIDRGTCLLLQRVLVYYDGVLCVGDKTGLVENPMIISLAQKAVTGECTSNSATMSGSDPELMCTNEGLWEVSEPCLCSQGFEMKSQNGSSNCSKCPDGTISLGLSNGPCVSCPANSVSWNSEGTSPCPCIEGYFRTANDSFNVSCTKSPSVPLNLTVSNVTNTSVVLSWSSPMNGGGRPLSEIFYTLQIHRGIVLERKVILRSVVYIATGLTPGVQYSFSVTSENDVSSQDNNTSIRTLWIDVTTFLGVPSEVQDIQDYCTVIVWKKPAIENGHITSYTLTFQRGQTTIDIVVEPYYHHYVYHTSDIPSGIGPVTTIIKAKNELGYGPNSNHVVIACLSDPPSPSPFPSLEPSPCPTSLNPSPVLCPACPTLQPPATPTPCPTCPLWEPTSCPSCPLPSPCPTPTEEPCPTCLPCPICEPLLSCPVCSSVTCPTFPTPTPCPSHIPCPEPIECPECKPCKPCASLPPCETPTCPEPTCPEVTCPTCEAECPAEQLHVPGLVNNIRLQSCRNLTWDLPSDGGRCISEYRVRVYNGRTYGSSKQRRVLIANRRNVAMNWIPSGSVSINIRAKNGIGLAKSWGPTYSMPSECGNSHV